jgi:hypothetical protein
MKCESCNGERVLWIMSEFPVPCDDCNPSSPRFAEKTAERLYRKDHPNGSWFKASKFLKDEYREQATRAPR